MKKSEKILSALTIAFSIASICFVILNFIGRIGSDPVILFIGLTFLMNYFWQSSAEKSGSKEVLNAAGKINRLGVILGIVFVAVYILKIFFKINL